MTFADLEERSLMSDRFPVDTFKRVLYFHAHRASQKAIEIGWIQEKPDIPDCCSEADWEAHVEYFLETME